jgi:hypothetical protein
VPALSGACLIEHYEKALDLHSYCPREKKLMTEEDATRATPDNENEIISLLSKTPYISFGLNYLLYQLLEDTSYLETAYNQVQEKASEMEEGFKTKFLSYPIPKAIVEEWEKAK